MGQMVVPVPRDGDSRRVTERSAIIILVSVALLTLAENKQSIMVWWKRHNEV